MTRDEAIALRLKHTGSFTKAVMPAEALHQIVSDEVDFYIASGMLKPSKSKGIRERASDIVGEAALEWLESEGLTIVEASK